MNIEYRRAPPRGTLMKTDCAGMITGTHSSRAGFELSGYPIQVTPESGALVPMYKITRCTQPPG